MTAAGEGQDLAIRRPHRRVVAVGVSRDVDWLALAIGSDNVDIAVVVIILDSVSDMVAIG